MALLNAVNPNKKYILTRKVSGNQQAKRRKEEKTLEA
jgi:hypothetical protein